MIDYGNIELWEKVRRNKIAYNYILPAAILMAIVTAFPILYQIWMSFTNFSISNVPASMRRSFVYIHPHSENRGRFFSIFIYLLSL